MLKIKVLRANIIVQDFNIDLFSNTEEQCNNAVKHNQGIRETFSTGSQNQNHPGPIHSMPK